MHELTKVATVVGLLGFTFESCNSVLEPFPNETANQSVILVERGLVFSEPTRACSHCVRILAEHKRHLSAASFERGIGKRLFFASANLLYLPDRRIHHAPHINVFAVLVALVVQWSRGVNRLHRLGHGAQVSAHSGLVAERPHHNAGVVLVALDHSACAINNGRFPLWVVGGVVDPAYVSESVSF